VKIDQNDYFERAQSWGFSAQQAASRSQRTAWTAAGVMAGIAAFEAVALAMLVPLKTVEPVTLLVDRHTGYVQAIDPAEQKRLSANEALTQSFLAQYVTAREGFDRATVSGTYRRVALWSAGAARSTYLAEMPATNPASPFQRYPAGVAGIVRIKSISKIAKGTALVRFDTHRQDRNGATTAPQPWIAVIRYRYTDAPMAMEDRLVNPMGFQVLSYRRDAEAPPPQVAIAAPAAVDPALTLVAPPAATEAAAPVAGRAAAQARPAARPSSPAGATGRREVPANQVPLGSPLAAPRSDPATEL